MSSVYFAIAFLQKVKHVRKNFSGFRPISFAFIHLSTSSLLLHAWRITYLRKALAF